MPERAKDGRRRVDPPCEFGHHHQAMECPSCAERLTDEMPSPEWWTWYRRRYQKPATTPQPQDEEER
jgi:hypothetical protein